MTVADATRPRNRHIFVFGMDGEFLSWSSGAPDAVPATLVRMVRGCLEPLATGSRAFSEIVMHLDERYSIHIVRNERCGPDSYAVVVEETRERV